VTRADLSSSNAMRSRDIRMGPRLINIAARRARARSRRGLGRRQITIATCVLSLIKHALLVIIAVLSQFCRTRPKYDDGTKVYDFCSKQCAQNAKSRRKQTSSGQTSTFRWVFHRRMNISHTLNGNQHAKPQDVQTLRIPQATTARLRTRRTCLSPNHISILSRIECATEWLRTSA